MIKKSDKSSNESGSVPADPSQWNEKSKNSISYRYTKEYKDISYHCWKCQKAAVFSAKDQQHTYEVKKAPIDQKRKLCLDCWKESLAITNAITLCEKQWMDKKDTLRLDKNFLAHWLELLTSEKSYNGHKRYKPNIATENMLKKLLAQSL